MRQARRYLLALAALFPLQVVHVFSRDPDHRRRFAEEMQPYITAELLPVGQPQEVVAGADLIVCATGSNVPVFVGAWLEPGQHVTSIVGSNKELVRQGAIAHRRREMDDTTLRRADQLVVTLREQGRQDEQSDLWEPAERGIIAWERVARLSELVSGQRDGWTAPQQLTLFRENIDQGIGRIGLARYAMRTTSHARLGWASRCSTASHGRTECRCLGVGKEFSESLAKDAARGRFAPLPLADG